VRSAIVAFIAFVVYVVLKEEVFHNQLDWKTQAIYILILMPILLGVGTPAKKADDKASQVSRDSDFRERVEQKRESPGHLEVSEDRVVSDEDRRAALRNIFSGVLFLRPFDVDKKFFVRNPRKDGFAASFFFYKMLLPSDVSLDDAVRYHSNFGDVLAIGTEGDDVGATRYETSESSWRADFLALATAARRLVVIPALAEGTKWEIGEICRVPMLLEKTVFLLTPLYSEERFGFAPLPAVCGLLRGHDLAVPDNAKPGEGLVFDSQGRLRDREEVLTRSLLEWKVRGRALKQLLAAAASRSVTLNPD
jgi:hypothetical protein